MRPILASVLFLACAREAVSGASVTDYGTLFNDHVEITFPNAPHNALYDFPYLVKLSEGAPSGFSYARVDPLGEDIRFVFVEDNVSNAVPYDVDCWNTNGVSTLWVKLPKYSEKASLKLLMYWAPDDPEALPANAPRSVWDAYTAVWHMNNAAESTTNVIVSTAGEKASVQTGIIGSALGTRAAGPNGPILQVPAGTAIDAITNGAYTISGWLRANLLSGGLSAWLYSARTNAAASAYGVSLDSKTDGARMTLWTGSGSTENDDLLPTESWVHFAVVHKAVDGKHQIFVNGVQTFEGAESGDFSSSLGFSFGGLAGTAGTLNGDLDEIRIYPGALTQSPLSNDYAQVVSTNRLAFTNFYSNGKAVYVKDPSEEKEPGEDPTPQSSGDYSTADYAGTAVIVPSDSMGAGVALTNFVMLVKVWEGEPAGFIPKNLPFGNEDIRFFDQDGNPLQYEIDTWDVNGISYFWVLVPRLTHSSKITMCWGLKEGKTLPPVDPTAVWAEDYAGVWHMSDATDSTANRAQATFGSNAVLKAWDPLGSPGQVGKAAGTKSSGAKGSILDITSNEVIDALKDETFTASGLLYLNKSATKYGALFSRGSADDPAWGAQFCGGTAGDSSSLAVQTGSSSLTGAVSIATLEWVRFDIVYSANRLALYIDGERKAESTDARTLLNGSSGRLSIGSFVAAAGETLGANTLNGYIDEFRLYRGTFSATEVAVDSKQRTDDDYYTRQTASWDDEAILQNRWRVLPTASKTEWNEGEDPATFTMGVPWYGTSTNSYQVRSTGEMLAEMPTEAGDYRVVFTVPAVDRYSSITYSIDFRIRLHRPRHDLGDENDRILLLNDDDSIADGKVLTQAYNDTEDGSDRPYWVHDVDSGYDYTSTSPSYNYCGGLRHTYWSRDGSRRLWDLLDVRYGNTYNNSEIVFAETGDWEEWDDGLSPTMNYLSWNPEGGCLVDEFGLLAEGWHEYAAQAVLCDSLTASINSTLYTNGIGTIYFDCVNSHTDDATNGYYKLVVEYATNALDRATLAPSGLPTDENIEASHDEWSEERQCWVEVVHDPYKFADWKRLTMHVRLVNGETMTDLGTTNVLDLSLAGGGSYTNFYRVYIPLDCLATARFRIRRVSVNPDYTISKDVHSMILVDNVICSKPTARIRVTPRGFYDEKKVARETAGYEGAFLPSYPSVSDAEIYARVKVTTQSGDSVPAEHISSVLMHYRWRYLNQQATDWLTADFDPNTLVTLKPISWPRISGDIEYWYEAGQAGEFYSYADYSGLGVGLEGYSEEVAGVTNRAPTYVAETETGDWYTRIRDGKSTYGEIKLFVRRGDSTEVETVDMFVARDQIWRGCLQATNAVADGISFRFEARNCQDDTLADFQFNTNRWYLKDAAETLPVSGSVVVGTTNDWGRVPCDGATGYLLFQLDESTRALTVCHADWQDFNGWNDVHRPYFSGASTEDGSRSGRSSAQREYGCDCSQWDEDSPTNSYWTERFAPSNISGYEFFQPFETARSPNGFDVGEGQWVPSAYAITAKVDNDHYEQALQMAGQGRGWAQLVDPTDTPRGLEAVKFTARIAQIVSPDDFAVCKDGAKLTDYTFLTRVAFDQNNNSNFTGNASLSLAAFYQYGESCYEARWEQINGNIEKGSYTIMGPTPRGQRLALYRWTYEGREWKATELYAATNSAETYAWKYSPLAIPTAHSFTNGLMPFMIGAYDDEDNDETLIIAAVLIPNQSKTAAENTEGVTAKATVANLAGTQGWLYLVYRDTDSQKRLKTGSYGVLSANCEGIFVHPQLHDGIVSWKNRADTLKLATQVWPSPSGGASHPETATFYLASSVKECAVDLVDGWWSVPSGRLLSFCDSEEDPYARITAAVVTQSVDIYTAPIGTTSWSTKPAASCSFTGFGKPGVFHATTNNFWSTDDVSVRLRAGGKITGVRTDVVIDNIEITQWRGQDWLGEDDDDFLTNFVYTSGWVTDGALQLSPRRTPDDYPCSLRGPLCDGQGTRKYKRGLGLGSFSIWYRNAQPNARLCVQIATNGVSYTELSALTQDPGDDPDTWTTVTNWNFATLPSSGVLTCSPGLHGVVGVMRVIVDPTLRAEVKDGTDPDLFGSIEITEALFRDEPPLDTGSWWGFNIRTIGDLDDTERRMYLPDNPLRSLNPTLDEIGRSLALNNSITEDCDTNELAKGENPFREHMPFLQTPTFTSNIVGEVSFRARKYSLQKGSQCAEVALYGTRSPDIDKLKDKDWDLLNIFLVSNTTFETYRYKTDASAAYRAFRFAVTGVDGVLYPGPEPVSGGDPVRVLLDDVLVSEAVRARLAFRNVGAFRHYLSKTTVVPDVPSAEEQPIVGEGWGVQAEIYPAMLGEEIDQTDKPRVRLHYYKGLSPWGYSQWKSKSSAVSAWMTMATDTNSFYRSSAEDSPAAVIPMANSTEVVQYMLEVVYTVVNPETGGRSIATNWLETADWSVPSWYYPVDYNLTQGGGQTEKFAAYSIIESIAPGWAWINEINIFGEYVGTSTKNTDVKKQFVEVVKPVDYDLNGWTLRMLAAKAYGAKASSLITNDVAIFGRNIPKQKEGTAKCSHMSFIVVGNKETELTGTEYDGAWNFTTLDNRVFKSGGVLGHYYPVAIQLVRPTGIIAHEVAIDGTNAFNETYSAIAWQYSTTNLVRMVRDAAPESNVFAVPDDNTSVKTSTGVFGSARGETELCWNNTMKLTPGEQNEGQTIPQDYPRPGGELIMVFASVDTSFGHILQTVGAGTNTTETQTITLASDSKDGLDIVYTIAPWCELGTVRETEGSSTREPIITKVTNRVYKVNVGKGAVKNVTVLASAQVDSELRKKYGLDENNRYTPAVLHWLETGKDAYDNEFYDTKSCVIKLAKFLPISGGDGEEMTLTQMYWLDMDPTVGEMYFRAGMVKPPSQVVVEKPTYDPQSDPKAYTNLRVGVYMSISNGNGKATNGKTVWAPYVLRGLGPDELSWNYSPSGSTSGAWTSETFKVTGYLNANLTSITNREAWVPLRYFVFWQNSFDSNFESEIDVIDPFSTQSPAYSEGWSRWVEEHGGVKPPVYLRWDIDERLRPITAEILAPTNRLDGTGP